MQLTVLYKNESSTNNKKLKFKAKKTDKTTDKIGATVGQKP